MKLRLLWAGAVLLAVPSAGPVRAQAPVAEGETPRAAGTEVAVPKRSKFVQPEYPPAALAQGLRGIVILALTIDTAGKVSAVDVVRSLPPFDDAAVAAARQWEYEVTRVDGRAVPVRLTVPITFALKLPDMSRDPAIPELRQGVAPPFPSDARAEPATVTADVTIDPSGQIVEAEIKSGSSPWTEALLVALRTWRFSPMGGDRLASFQVRADFLPATRGSPRVELKLSGLRQGDMVGERRTETSVTPAPAPSMPAPSPVGETAPAGAPAAAAPDPPAEPASAAPAAATPDPGPPPDTAPPATAPPSEPAPAPPVSAPATAPPVADPAPPTGAPPNPAPTSVPPANPSTTTGTPAATAPAAAGAPGAPPAVEVIPAAPPPPPRVEPGVSAVQGVLLGAGVPDLSRGRRPIAPPIARMNQINGNVEVRFVVEASGASSVRDVIGPELLKEAARQTVGSWTFRRTTPERLPLVAVFSYIGDGATASVNVVE
jgi:TonB family protein